MGLGIFSICFFLGISKQFQGSKVSKKLSKRSYEDYHTNVFLIPRM